jgi:putative acetyltransferase
VQENRIIRPATREDELQLVRLIDEVYREYGDEVDLEGYDRDLLDVEAAYREVGGEFVVMEEDGRISGAHATQPINRDEGIVTFRRLYLPPRNRGTGAGKALMDWAVGWSRKHGYRRVEFWSDTRFTRAHRFFARYGFVQAGIRHVEEGTLSFSEFHFSMDF